MQQLLSIAVGELLLVEAGIFALVKVLKYGRLLVCLAVAAPMARSVVCSSKAMIFIML